MATFALWYFAIFLVFTICAGSYYASNGGLHTSRGEYIASGIWALANLVLVFFVGSLTWLGWVFVAVFAWDTIMSFVNAGQNPGGRWKEPGWLILSVAVSIAMLIGLLTVGLTI